MKMVKSRCFYENSGSFKWGENELEISRLFVKVRLTKLGKNVFLYIERMEEGILMYQSYFLVECRERNQ